MFLLRWLPVFFLLNVIFMAGGLAEPPGAQISAHDDLTIPESNPAVFDPDSRNDLMNHSPAARNKLSQLFSRARRSQAGSGSDDSTLSEDSRAQLRDGDVPPWIIYRVIRSRIEAMLDTIRSKRESLEPISRPVHAFGRRASPSHDRDRGTDEDSDSPFDSGSAGSSPPSTPGAVTFSPLATSMASAGYSDYFSFSLGPSLAEGGVFSSRYTDKNDTLAHMSTLLPAQADEGLAKKVGRILHALVRWIEKYTLLNFDLIRMILNAFGEAQQDVYQEYLMGLRGYYGALAGELEELAALLGMVFPGEAPIGEGQLTAGEVDWVTAVDELVQALTDALERKDLSPEMRNRIRAFLQFQAALYQADVLPLKEELEKKVRDSVLAFLAELAAEILEKKEVVYMEKHGDLTKAVINLAPKKEIY